MSLEAGILIGIAVMVYTFAYMSVNVKGDFGVLKFIYHIVVFLLGIVFFTAGSVLATNNNKDSLAGILDAGLQGNIWIMILVLAILFFFILWNIMEQMGKLPSQQR